MYGILWKSRKRSLKSASCTLMSLNGAHPLDLKIGLLGARVLSAVALSHRTAISSQLKLWLSHHKHFSVKVRQIRLFGDGMLPCYSHYM